MKFAMDAEGVPGELRPRSRSQPGELLGKAIEGTSPARSTTGRASTYIAQPPFFDDFAMAACPSW